MIPLLESPAAQRLAWTLLHFLWQGALLGLLAWGTFALLRRQRPQLRYLAGCAFLFACLGATAVTYAVLSPAPHPPFPAAGFTQTAPVLDQQPSLAPSEIAAPVPMAVSQPWRARLQPYLPWVLATWATGVLFLSLRAAGGWIWLRRLKALGTPITEPEWLECLVQKAKLRRVVRFLESARVVTPMCMGLLRPVILLPLGFFAHLDPLAAEAVLAHELAHLRRLDGLVNGLQCMIEVLFFFHPAVWWISRRIRTEREHCCDDAAVLACGDVVLYAETLIRLDETRPGAPAAALQARGGNLVERMRRLLLADPPRLLFTTPAMAIVALLAMAAALPAKAEKPAPPPPTLVPPAPVMESSHEDFRITARPRPIQALPARAMPALELPNAPGPIATHPSAQEPRTLIAEYPQERPAQAPGTPEHPPQPVETQTPPKPGIPPSPQAANPTPGLTSPWPAWRVARGRPASAAWSSLDCGPEPTKEEALAFVKIMADRSLWGPRTQVKQVEVVGKSRWYASLTNRWPRGKNLDDTIVGWEIAFLAKPSQVMAPYGSFQLRSILVDKDRVVHWHTHTQWDNDDNILPKRN